MKVMYSRLLWNSWLTFRLLVSLHQNAASQVRISYGLQVTVSLKTVRIAVITVRNEVAKVMFLQVSVCPQEGWGCLPQCMLGYHMPPEQTHIPTGSRHPSRSRPPPEQVPPGADTPEQTPPPKQTPPRSRHPPPRYSHCCGRYASYWNAFLFVKTFP